MGKTKKKIFWRYDGSYPTRDDAMSAKVPHDGKWREGHIKKNAEGSFDLYYRRKGHGKTAYDL